MEENVATDAMEVALMVPKSQEQQTLALLGAEPSFNPQIVPSVGVEGGGALSSIVLTLAKPAIEGFSQILSRLISGHEITLQVGQTTLHTNRLRNSNSDVVSLLERVLEAELKRIAANQKRPKPK
jgi:hypothetical protein